MKLTYKGLKDAQAWEKAGVLLPPYDPEALSEKTKADPRWVHFGIGNIFRIELIVLTGEKCVENDTCN